MKQSISTPITGFSVLYGVSNNHRAPVDNAKAQHLEYRAKDFAVQIYAVGGPIDPADPTNTHHGGPFAAVELGNSGVAHLNLNADDTAKE